MKTLFILISSVTFCFAQESYKGSIIKHFDKDWKEISNTASATFFRTVETNNDAYIIRDYYLKTGILQMEAECDAYIPKLSYNGKVSWYYDNGNLKEESVYVKNKRNGPGRTYYRNGKLREDVVHDEGVITYKGVYDREGHDILIDGTGTYADTLNDRATITYVEVVRYKYLGCFVIEKSDTIYLTAEKQAEYNGGLNQLATDLKARLIYPKSARRTGHAGVVYVSFVVTKQGMVADPRVVKGFHADCDAEALRVVKTLEVWKPGEHRGKKVNSRFVLPVRFTLEW